MKNEDKEIIEKLIKLTKENKIIWSKNAKCDYYGSFLNGIHIEVYDSIHEGKIIFNNDIMLKGLKSIILLAKCIKETIYPNI